MSENLYLSHAVIACVYQEQACAGGMLHYVAVSNLHMFDTVNTVAILDTYESCSTVPRSKGCSMITMLYNAVHAT